MTIAMRELKKKNILTFSIAAGHVLGGTTASFFSIADQIYSEDNENLIGFSGKRVIEQNIREKLSPEVQTSKWVLDQGQIDKIIPRHKLRDEIYNLLSILLKLKEKEETQDKSNVTIDKSLSAVS
jgi:acetyl-CoA carboxylase carboxyl transferase subunit beta